MTSAQQTDARTLRRCCLSLAAGAATGLLTLTSVMAAPLASGEDVTLVLGGTGLGIPNPPPSFIADGTNHFVAPNFPGFTSDNALGVYTPEQLYPLTGFTSLTLNQSVAHGVDILNRAILEQIDQGNRVAVLTVSQSAIIAGQSMSDLAALPDDERPDADQLGFVLLADPANPNGGLFARFPDMAFPALGVTLGGATPPDTSYPTAIYTLEYDGAADYPQYPINVLADLNALAGFVFLHPTIGGLTPEQIAAAIELPTDPAYGTATSYYLVPTENLPLLDPVRSIPVIGNPLADLIQPALKVIVNLGYGDPDHGYSTGPANAPTQAGFLPNVDVNTVVADLAKAAQRGWNDALNAFSNVGSDEATSNIDMSNPFASLGAVLGVSAPPVPIPTISPGDPVGNVISVLQALTTNTISNLTAMLGAQAAAILPMTQIAMEAVTTVPSANFTQALSAVDTLAGGDFNGFVDGIGAIPGQDVTLALFAGLLAVGTILNPLLTDTSALHNIGQGNVDIISALLP